MKIQITIVLMMLCLYTGTSLSQDKQDWKFMHPTPHSNLVKKVRMVDENNWVGVGGNGTFMHTTNSGNNWYYHFFAGRVAATLATTNCYDAWFFDSNTGIVVGDQGYIGRTVDGGVTFDTAGSSLVQTNSRNWSIWFADANTGYIGAGSQTAFTSRILKTTNGGLNWSISFQDNSGSVSYIVSLGGADGQTVCAALANGTCIRTTDGGATWNSLTSAFTGNKNSISFADATTGFTAGSGGSFARTTNAGLNWVELPTPQTDWSYFQVKVVSVNEIYLVGDPGFLYKSTDQGSSWSNLPISASGPASTFIWYSLDHSGSTYTLSGDYGQVAKSTDGCASWTVPGYFQLTTQLMFDIASVPGTSKYWAVGRAYSPGTRELLYSSNGGSNWTPYNVGGTGELQSISMINENTGYVSGQNNRVLKTTDGGASWFAKTGPSPSSSSQLYSCEFIDENTGWVFVNFSTVAGGNVFKTTNGGDNWTQYSTGAASENIYSAEMVNANTGFCVMNQSGRPIYRTTNGGVNWTGATTTGFTGSIHGISSPDGITVYACQTSGTSRVAKSTNGGVNWTLITMPVAADFSNIDFKDVNTGYVTGNLTTVVARTTNGGLNWTYQNTHAVTNGKVFVSPGDTAFCLGGNTAILRFIGPANSIKVNLSMIMEGMYNTSTEKLRMRDTVRLYLRSAVSPYAIVDSAKTIIDSVAFSGLFEFNNAPSGQYYLVTKHRNTVETWSKSGGEALVNDGSTYNYSFITASSQAFGNNMIEVDPSPSRYGIYSGDITHDGTVNLTDIVLTLNNTASFVNGYVDTDLNGDNTTNLTDILIASNNSSLFVHKITP